MSASSLGVSSAAPASMLSRLWPRLDASSAGDRWFAGGVRVFSVLTLLAAVALGVMWLPQLRVLAAVALVQAVLGVVVCAWGLHVARRERGGSAEWPMADRMRAKQAATCSVSKEASCPTFSIRST